jgi:hypothetical protein
MDSNPERTADASSLLVVMNIEALAAGTDTFIVTEFIHSENMHLVGPSNLATLNGKKELASRILMRPVFMAGHVYAQSMLDTVICQNYYK